MSSPLAAMSVATRTRIVPFLKAERARSLAPCDLSPWIASTRTPARLRVRSTRSAPCRVRVNTRAFLISSPSRSVFSRSALDDFST